MPEILNYQQLARQYGLEPVPESVLRLTQIVAKQDADLEEIGRAISKDPDLTRRLLRAANPRAKSEADFDIESVEQALMRNGLGCALLLAMGTPLALALVKTFQTMLSLKLEHVDGSYSVPGQHILGTIGFSGRAAGSVYLRLGIDSAKAIAAQILGMKPAEITSTTDLHDTVGELLNIMAGNFKSNLCDAGLPCILQPPHVGPSGELPPPAMVGASVERMTFRAGAIVLLVELWVNPWNGE